MKINLRSAYRIFQQYTKTNRRQALPSGGHPPRKLNQQMIDEIMILIWNKPTTTLQEMLLHFDQSTSGSQCIDNKDASSRWCVNHVEINSATSFPVIDVEWSPKDVDLHWWMWMQCMDGTLSRPFDERDDREQFEAWSKGNVVRIWQQCLAVSPQIGFVHYNYIECRITKEVYAFMS